MVFNVDYTTWRVVRTLHFAHKEVKLFFTLHEGVYGTGGITPLILKLDAR